MKETGIIMSGNHPRLILNILKTMTRRTKGLKEINEYPDLWKWFGFDNSGRYSFRFKPGDRILSIRCPFGQVGDKLWVRETWAAPASYDDLSPLRLWHKPKVWYLADGPKPAWAGITRSPLFMHRWASRILLEITEVRVEKLQKISGQDIKAEGLDVQFTFPGAFDALERFSVLWDSLNAKRGYGWKENPWVWVISFRRVEG